MDDLISSGVGVTDELLAWTVLGVSVDSAVASSETLSVHSSVRSDVIKLLEDSSQRHFSFSCLLHLHLDNVVQWGEIVVDQQAQTISWRKVRVFMLSDRCQEIQKVLKI
jgi:hypothetical protein